MITYCLKKINTFLLKNRYYCAKIDKVLILYTKKDETGRDQV